jgi:hypothetical protein
VSNQIDGGQGANLTIYGGGVGDTLQFAGEDLALTGATSVSVGSNSVTIGFGESPSQGGTLTSGGVITATATFNGDLSGHLTIQDPNGAQHTQNFTSTEEEFNDVGAAFGSSLGNQLAGDNLFARIGTSAALKTVVGDAAGLLGAAAGGATGADLGQLLNQDLDTFLPTLYDNLATAGIGAISSFLAGDFINSLGLDGPGGQLATDVTGSVIGQVGTNIYNGATTVADIFNGVDGAFDFGINQFVDQKIADAIYTPDTQDGQEGAAVGEAVGDIIFGPVG